MIAPPLERLPLASGTQTLLLLWHAVKKRPVLAIATLLASLGAAGVGLVIPWLIGEVTDLITVSRQPAQLLPWALMAGGAAVLTALLAWVSASLVGRLGQHLLAQLREDALAATLALPPHRIEASGSGDVLSRLGDDVAVAGRMFTNLLGPLVAAILAVLLTVGGLAVLHPVLAVAGLSALPVYYFSLRWYLPRAARRYLNERELFAQRAEIMNGSLHGARTLRAYGAQEIHGQHIERSSARARDASVQILWFYTQWAKWLNFAELAGLAMILISGFFLVHGQAASLGAVTAATVLFHRLFNPIGTIISSFDDVQSAAASLRRIAGLARLQPADRSEAAADSGGIQVREIGFGYGKERLFERFSLEIAPGEQVVLVGASGSGKSTLALLIAGMLTPDSGSISVGTAASGAEGTGQSVVALATQEAHIFTGSIAENLRLAAPLASTAQLWQVLASVEAERWVTELPSGLNCPVGENGHQISAVQAAQLALARILLADPQVVILDEASAESTARGVGILERAMQAVMAGRTAVVVAHRLNQTAQADRVLVMEKGRIIQDGSPAQLLARGGKYAQLWRAWESSPR